MFSTPAGRPPVQRKRISKFKAAIKPLKRVKVDQPTKPALLIVARAKKSTLSIPSSSQQSNVLEKPILTAFTNLLQKVLEDKDSIEQILSKVKLVTEEELKVTVTAKKGRSLCAKNFDFRIYFDDDSYIATNID